jgi:hypothetical protein
MDGLAQAGWRKARDEACQAAIEQAKDHFHRCARCHQYVCDLCWKVSSGLCMNCSPSVEAEIEAARTQGQISAAAEKAMTEGMDRGKRMDMKTNRQLVCPQCGQPTSGGKFCGACGFKLAVVAKCPECDADVPPNAKFCAECGQKV